MPWLTAAKWIGTGAGVSGAIMIALNLGLVIYGKRAQRQLFRRLLLRMHSRD